ncbi:MAG: RluA family pseudouridine synthase [Alphaproteobacteria bacterium]|nr:RluA family pseudouridine synthase [Alphaproteobacteria bacterium]
MSGVQHKTVTAADDGQRLDRWFKKHVPGVPFGLLQKLIRKGQIRVDGKRAKTDTRLTAGQDVRIPPLADHETEEKPVYRLSPGDKDFVAGLVIYDDGDIVAINKPGGLPSQGGSGQLRHVDGLLEALKNKDGLRPHLIHRLDKETSGVLLCARTPESIRALGKSFTQRSVKKIYGAILSPAPESQDGTIRAPLSKIKDRSIIDEENGKYAETDFIVLDRLGNRAAFVAFWPRTGRNHQIRVHAAAALGCPVLGDNRYARRPDQNTDKDGTDGPPPPLADGLAKRVHLHAFRLRIPHPRTRQILDIAAPLPHDLVKSWKRLGFTPTLKHDPFEE